MSWSQWCSPVQNSDFGVWFFLPCCCSFFFKFFTNFQSQQIHPLNSQKRIYFFASWCLWISGWIRWILIVFRTHKTIQDDHRLFLEFFLVFFFWIFCFVDFFHFLLTSVFRFSYLFVLVCLPKGKRTFL